MATAYTKLNQTTEEGGAQPKEYEFLNASDRVRNVSVVWMGATLGCAQCHAHKFDPYSLEDFYSLAAFFADIQEPAIIGMTRVLNRETSWRAIVPAVSQKTISMTASLGAKVSVISWMDVSA